MHGTCAYLMQLLLQQINITVFSLRHGLVLQKKSATFAVLFNLLTCFGMIDSLALLEHATAAMQRAIAPYSSFRVGAALQTSEGKIYTGHNIESSSYSLTICAERVALFKALSEGERTFEAMAIVASSGEFCPPCGACRQVLMDFAPHLVIYLSNQHGQIKTFRLAELLPEAFSSETLSKMISKSL
jgi:cytidine deaminase